ncbi:hypothetical protein EV426DRAFT_683753 [Tirmania nivea]|nr:hypothetical protein EV426DRAFT_683753 [Tirmania nivea]
MSSLRGTSPQQSIMSTGLKRSSLQQRTMPNSKKSSPSGGPVRRSPAAKSTIVNPTGHSQREITEAQSDITWCSLFTEHEDAIGRDNPGISTEERRIRAVEELKALCRGGEALNSLSVFEQRLFQKYMRGGNGHIHTSSALFLSPQILLGDESADSHTTLSTENLADEINVVEPHRYHQVSIATVTPARNVEEEPFAFGELTDPSAVTTQRAGEGAEQTLEYEESELSPSPQGLAIAVSDPFVDETAAPTHQMLIHSESLGTPILGDRLRKPKMASTSPNTSSARNSLGKGKPNGGVLEYPRTPVKLRSPVGMPSASSQRVPSAKSRVGGSFSERTVRCLRQADSTLKVDVRSEGQDGTGSLPLSTPTRHSMFEQVEVSEGVGAPASAMQGIHTALLEANSSRKAGNPEKAPHPLVVREKQDQCPRVHKRKPIPSFESPGPERSPPCLDIFSPRRPWTNFDRGSLNTPSPSVRTPLKQACLAEAANLRAYGEVVSALSTEVQCNPVGPSESNTGAGSVGPEKALGVNGPNGVQVGKALSTIEGPLLKGDRMGADISELGPRAHLDGRRTTKAVGARTVFMRAPRIEKSLEKLQAHCIQSSSLPTWPRNSALAKVPDGSPLKVLTGRSSEVSVNNLAKAEPTAHKDYEKQGKQSTWHSSITFNRKPWKSRGGMETKKEKEVSATANSRNFLRNGSGKKNIPTALQIGLPATDSFRHLNSNGIGTEPPMLTHTIQNSLNSTEPQRPSSAVEKERRKLRPYRGFAGFFSQNKGNEDKGKGKDVATSTRSTQSFLIRFKGSASSLGNAPRSTLNALSRHTNPKAIKAPNPPPMQLNLHPFPSPKLSPPHAFQDNHQFYQLQDNQTNTITGSKNSSTLPHPDTSLDIDSFDKEKKLTGSSSLPALKRVSRQATLKRPDEPEGHTSAPDSAPHIERDNNDSLGERVPADFLEALTPDGNLPTSQNIFELDNAMSRMKIYSDLAQAAANQATAAFARADAAADRAVAAWDAATAARDAATAARDAAAIARNEAMAANAAVKRQRRRVFHLINQWNINMNAMVEQGITPRLN